MNSSEWNALIRESADRHIIKTSDYDDLKTVPLWNTAVYWVFKHKCKHLRALRKLAPDNLVRPSKLKEFLLARARARTAIWDAKEGAWADFTTKITDTTCWAELWRQVKVVNGNNRHHK